MFYFSSILDRAVKNGEGEHIGKISDFLINRGENYPRINYIILSVKRKRKKIPWDRVKHADQEGVIIKGTDEGFPEVDEDAPDFVFLKRDILDMQIVDIDGHRVVRVNDIQLNNVGKDLRVAGVDVGTPGLLRRMGFLEISEHIARLLKLRTPTNIIPWNMVQTLGTEPASPIRLATTQKKLTRLHPADLADILEELSGSDRIKLFETLDNVTAADTLEELEEEVQIAIFKNLSDEKAADLLEEMAPDDAADLLQDIPDERAEALLGLMDAEDARDVQELLLYEEDTAGGLMSNDFITVPPEMTCQETINHMRELSPDYEQVYYIHTGDKEGRLLGTIPLINIVVSSPDKVLKDIMTTDLVTVRTNAEVKEITELIAKYDLLSIPVVDENFVMKGIITVDDVMEQLLG